jgi:hypothetical protein
MEYTQNYLLNQIGNLNDKLNRIEHIAFLTDINNDLKISMIRGVIKPQ